jgi:hypothetical protein
MDVIFKNNGSLSLLDLTTMGDSSKRGDDTKIGRYDSGLKYALSILYRNGIEVLISTKDCFYTFSSEIVKDTITNKVKELLVIHEHIDDKIIDHITAFSPNLGYDWKLWMAIRELFSNCIDENGIVLFGEDVSDNYDITITLKSNDLLDNIISNWNSFFINDIPLYQDNNIKIYKNLTNSLKLYKNGILIYEKDTKSKYNYDYKLASIDEMRVLNDYSDFKSSIEYSIQHCTSKEFIKTFIEETNDDNLLESNLNYYGSHFNDEWKNIVNNLYSENGVINCNKALKESFIECSGMDIGFKKLSSSFQNNYYWSTAKVEIILTTEEKELSFQDKINDLCREMKFTLSYPIEESNIENFIALPDFSNKKIYISNDINKDNFWQLVKAQFRLEGKDDINYVFKEYVKLLTFYNEIIN